MPERKRGIDIDGQVLRKYIELLGKSLSQVSKELGYNGSFMSKCIRTNRLPKSAAIMIEKLYNIPLVSYEKPEMSQQIVEDHHEQETSDIDYQKLGDVIYNAVYEAVKKAWSE